MALSNKKATLKQVNTQLLLKIIALSMSKNNVMFGFDRVFVGTVIGQQRVMISHKAVKKTVRLCPINI